MNRLPAIGSWVRLMPDVSPSNKAARVLAHMNQERFPGGVRLDRRLDGFQHWNITELRRAKAPSPK